MFLSELERDGSGPDAPEAIRRDWQTVANWLEHTTGELSGQNSGKLGKAWNAYLAIGVAPSFKLQSTFDLLAGQVGKVPTRDRAPTAVMNVFDRLLATDIEIKAKRESDWRAEKERFRAMFEKLKDDKRANWWRRQPWILRSWVFGSGVWMTFAILCTVFFDPFDVGGWEYMSDDETTQLALILLAPIGAAAVFFAYCRWVK